ncbi:sporulation integral membrane protein YlbJ [Virgibacillus phasianinus]|uniref:Sporulation integral membrane protein YlbJ n=2 Tax=Virgibacillus phasianinus TaxID=2017483 RepID=A0A220U986_9BACI|nr:sporulation integral membrane protein YlbJ [Virgibacillus phasianinus]
MLFAGTTLFMTFALITYPDQAFEASLRGLSMWLEKVFPSLLPFFITAELLIGFGVVKFLGVLCEPIMRPLFNVPGVGSFAWAMGMASGYPTGAKISVRLREEKQLTRLEGERLVSFTNASSPLFIFGVVAVGFFYDAKLGILLAIAHYGGNALVGICMRFYGREESSLRNRNEDQKVSIVRAFQEMHSTRLKDPRPIGEIFGDAVINSIKTLVMVGGFIIIFSVFIKLLYIVGISPVIASIFKVILHLFSMPVELALPIFSGLFEITIGSDMITKATADPLIAKVVAVSFILGFNGFSIQAQVASILAKSDLRFFPYFFGRILHGTFASILILLLYKPFYLDRKVTNLDGLPVAGHMQENFWQHCLDYLQMFGPIISIFFISLAFLILLRRQLIK